MIGAMAVDYDFCFTDIRRIGHYESYLRHMRARRAVTSPWQRKKNGFSVIAPEEFIGLMIRSFRPGLYSGL